MIKHIRPKRLETIAHMPSPMTAEKGLGLLSTIGGSVRMLRVMWRADPIRAARLPLPKECQSAINTAKIRDFSTTVGNRPLQSFDAEKHTHKDLL